MYDRYLVLGEGKNLSLNTAVTVLWDGEDFYVVSINNEIGYMAKNQVSKDRYVVSSGGGGGEDWTPPAL